MKFHFSILLLAAVATAMPDASLCIEKIPEGADPNEVGLCQFPTSLGCLTRHSPSLFLLSR